MSYAAYDLAIIIPAYITSNQGLEDLKNLIEALKFQSDKRRYMIFVIDDCSTADISSLEKRFMNDRNILFSTFPKNLGVATARNQGLDFAEIYSCEYVTFVDADDDVTPDFIDILDDRIRSERENGQKNDIVQFMARHGDGNIAYPEPCAWGKLIKRSWVGDDMFDEDQLIGEEDTLFRKPGKTSVIAYDDRVIYFHRPTANPDSLMKRFWRGEIPRRRGGECYKPEADLEKSARLTCEEDS